MDVEELVRVRETLEQLARDGVEGLTGEQTEVVALEARRLRELADHAEVHALGSLDRSGYPNVEHGATTAGWFATATGLPHNAVRAQLKTARLLEQQMATTGQAWLDGTITRDHVRVLLDAANPRIRDEFAAEQHDLIAGVARTRFDVWKAHVAERVRLLDQDGPEPDDPTITSATWARSDAFAELQARFGGADAEVLEQIIERETDSLFRRHTKERRKNPELPAFTRNQLRGQAIVALLIESQAVDPASTTRPTTAVHLVVHAHGLPCINGDGEIDWPDLTASSSDVTWRITNPDGRRLTAEGFATLVCDPTVHPLLVDADGNPLKLGRKARLAEPPQRRAVLLRDGGCAFPGCDCTVGWADIHHVIDWDHGGRTDIDNLVAVCRRHHGVAHRRGWSLTAAGDGWFVWATPTGRTFWSQRHGTQRAGPAPPMTSTTSRVAA